MFDVCALWIVKVSHFFIFVFDVLMIFVFSVLLIFVFAVPLNFVFAVPLIFLFAAPLILVRMRIMMMTSQLIEGEISLPSKAEMEADWKSWVARNKVASITNIISIVITNIITNTLAIIITMASNKIIIWKKVAVYYHHRHQFGHRRCHCDCCEYLLGRRCQFAY